MARQLKSVFDTQLDAIAVALNAMYTDTVLSGTAADLADPRHLYGSMKICFKWMILEFIVQM